MNAGKLNNRVEILELIQNGAVFSWNAAKTVCAEAEILDRNNIFSSIGLSARSVEFTLRKQSLTLYNAVRWNGKHCFLTDIKEINRMYYEVTAALVEPVTCVVSRLVDKTGDDGSTILDSYGRPMQDSATVMTFPGCLTPKYAGYAWQGGHAEHSVGYVLVTPKIISLKPGDLIKTDDTIYNLTVKHTSDPYKNEYEIAVKDDI